LANKIGLRTPDAIVVEINNQQYQIPQEIKYPCFTKPMSSLNGGKQCVKRCGSREELQSVLDIAVRYGISNVLVEDYINIEKEYAILGFSDGKNVIIPGLIHFLKGSQTYPGVALMGKVQSVQGYGELIDKFALYVKKIGYIGIFDIDFFEAEGKFFFGELNFRIGASAYAITKMGINLPLMFVRTMQGESIEGIPCQIQGNSVYVNERLCILDWYRFKLSTKEYRKYIHAAEISFIIEENDPNPQKVYYRRYIIMYFKRIIKRLFHIN
jgi:carbamoylphosphate synthase large subunit